MIKGVEDVRWMVTPSGDTYFVCDICGEKFSDLTKYYDHLNRGHYKSGETSDENSKIYAYLVLHYGKLSKKLYSAISGLSASGSRNGKFVCPICGEYVLSKNNLKFHLAKKHGDSLLDSIELKFEDKDVLGHKGYILNALNTVAEKFKITTRNGREVYTCPKHKKIYPTEELFKKHLMQYHLGDIYEWAGFPVNSREDMIATIIQNSRLRFNIKRNGENVVVYKYRCPICGAFFDDKELYGLHLQDHDTPELVRGTEFSRKNYD